MPEIDLGYVLGPKGDPGEPGRDGTDGTPGAPGAPGDDGKSAYQYAKEGGFVGTEEQFYTALAEVVLKMNKVIPSQVNAIATLSAAGQAQDSGKTIADFATAEQIKNVYTKDEADSKFAGRDAFYTKDETMTAATGQLIASGVTTPNLAFQKLKEQVDKAQSTADSAAAAAKIVQGRYVGTDELTKTINLGFRPKLLIIRSNNGEEVRTGRGDLLLWMGQPSEYGGKTDPEVTTFSVTDTTFTMKVTKSDPSHGDWIHSSKVYNQSNIEYLYAGVG